MLLGLRSFFSFFFSSVFLDGPATVFFFVSFTIVFGVCDQTEHGISCPFMLRALEISSNGGLSKHVKSCPSATKYITWSWQIKWQISTIEIRKITKIDKVVTFNEELPLIKWNDRSITWFFKVKWQINNLISPTCTKPMITKHALTWWLTHDGLQPRKTHKHEDLWVH